MRQGGTAFHLAYDSARDVLLSGTFGSLMVSSGMDTLAVYGPEQGVHENDYILAVGVDAEGQHGGGSYEGLCRINPETGKIRNFTGDSLPGRGVYCIYTDTTGTTWFGGDEGLLYYDEGRKRVMPVQSEVLQSIVKAIAPLDENRLLVAAKDGLYIFYHRDWKAVYRVAFLLLNENSGYPDIEPGFNGLFVASDGKIWVTSASGVSALDPAKLNLRGTAQGIRITEVDGVRQPFNLGSNHAWTPLEYSRDDVEIVFEAIGFQRPSRTLYQYRLDGHEWTEWSEVDRVFLSNLREGRHKFEVRAGPSDQNYLDAPLLAKFNFEVSLPFWSEAWFGPIAIVFAAGLLIFGLTALWNQRQNRIQLEARLNEVRQLRSQLLLAELNPHFVFNALASIQHQVLPGDREAAADHLVRLSRLIRSFLQATHRGQELAAGVAERDISLAEELTLLGDYLHFERLKNEQHFDYKIEVDPGIDPQTTFVPPMMLQPFVENGIKHGLLPGPSGGLLSLHFAYLDEEAQQLRVTITDNGVGIQEKTERKKFPNQESLGRSIIEERVRLLNQLGYSISVETKAAEPKGTEVIIDFRELD